MKPATPALVPALVPAVLVAAVAWGFSLAAVGTRPPAEPPAAPAGDLSSRLGEATVTWGDKASRGRSPGGRWLGPSAREHWLWVGPHRGMATTDKGPEPRACIWAHAGDGPLRIAFPHGVGAPDGTPVDPAHDRVRIRGEVAVLDTPREGAAVDFRVLSGGRQLARARASDTGGSRRWAPWDVVVGVSDELTFELSTPKPDWRQVCFTARLEAP